MSGLEDETLASVRHMVFASTEVLGAAASIIESLEVDHPAVGHLATAIAAAELAKRQLAPLAPVIPLPDRRRPGHRPHQAGCPRCGAPPDDCYTAGACRYWFDGATWQPVNPYSHDHVGWTLPAIRGAIDGELEAYWATAPYRIPGSLVPTAAMLRVLACESILEAAGEGAS